MTEDSDGGARSCLDPSAFRKQMIGVFGPFDRFASCITSTTSASSGISNLHGVIPVPTTPVSVVVRADSRCASPNVSTAIMLQSMQNLVDRSPLHPPIFSGPKKELHSADYPSAKSISIENDENKKTSKKRQNPTEMRNCEEKRRKPNRETDEDLEASRDGVNIRLNRNNERSKQLFGDDPENETGKKAHDKGTPDSGVLSAENGLDESLPTTDTILSLLTNLSPMLSPPRFSRSADSVMERTVDTCISPIRTRPAEFIERARERQENDRKEAEKEKKLHETEEREREKIKKKEEERERKRRDKEEDALRRRKEEKEKKKEKEDLERKIKADKREKEEKLKKDERDRKDKEDARVRKEKEKLEVESQKRHEEEKKRKSTDSISNSEKRRTRIEEIDQLELAKNADKLKKKREQFEQDCDSETDCSGRLDISALEPEMIVRLRTMRVLETEAHLEKELFGAVSNVLKKNGQLIENGVGNKHMDGFQDEEKRKKDRDLDKEAHRKEKEKRKREKERTAEKEKEKEKDTKMKDDLSSSKLKVKSSMISRDLSTPSPIPKIVKTAPPSHSPSDLQRKIQKEKVPSKEILKKPVDTLKRKETTNINKRESDNSSPIPKIKTPRPPSEASSPAPSLKKHPNGKRTDSPLPSTSAAGGFICALSECEANKALRPEEPPAGSSPGEYFQTLAKETKHTADKEPDKVLRLLLYLDSVAFFIRSCSSSSQASRLQSVLKETNTLLKFVSSHFLRSESLTTLHKHFRGRLRSVISKAQAIICYHIYSSRSDSSHTIKQLRLIDTLEKTQIEPILDGSTPSPCGSAQSGSGGSANKPSTSVGKVQMPAALATMYTQQLKTLSNLLWAHRFWDESNLDCGTLEKNFIAKIELLCGRISVDSSLETLMSFIMTSANCMRMEFEKEKTRPPPNSAPSVSGSAVSSMPSTLSGSKRSA